MPPVQTPAPGAEYQIDTPDGHSYHVQADHELSPDELKTYAQKLGAIDPNRATPFVGDAQHPYTDKTPGHVTSLGAAVAAAPRPRGKGKPVSSSGGMSDSDWSEFNKRIHAAMPSGGPKTGVFSPPSTQQLVEAKAAADAQGLKRRDQAWNGIAGLKNAGVITSRQAAQMRMVAPGMSLTDRLGGLWDTIFGHHEDEQGPNPYVQGAQASAKAVDSVVNSIMAGRLNPKDPNDQMTRQTIHNLDPLEQLGMLGKLITPNPMNTIGGGKAAPSKWKGRNTEATAVATLAAGLVDAIAGDGTAEGVAKGDVDAQVRLGSLIQAAVVAKGLHLMGTGDQVAAMTKAGERATLKLQGIDPDTGKQMSLGEPPRPPGPAKTFELDAMLRQGEPPKEPTQGMTPVKVPEEPTLQRPATPIPVAEDPTLSFQSTPKGPRYISADGHPFTEERVPTKDIGVLKGMQYKDSEVTDYENMVSPKLKGVTKWDPSAAGIVSLWQDADGKYWAMNAHHRLELANRVSQPDLLAHVYRESDGVTFEKAKIEGALQNMREGNGTAIDAAGVMRDAGITADQLQEFGVPQRSGIARDATGLAKLPEPAWAMVRSGRVAESVAAAIGDAGLSENRTIQALEQAEKSGLSTRSQGEILARKAEAARVKKAIKSSQTVLFGDDVPEDDGMLHWGSETEIEDAVSKAMAKDQRLFVDVAKGRAATGSVINVEAQLSAAGKEEFARKMIGTSDAIQEAIKNEAIKYEDNPTPAAKQEAVARIAELARSQVPDWVSRQASEPAGPTQSPALSVRDGASGDTASSGQAPQGQRWYHGTSRPIEVGSIWERPQDRNLYGPGFYMTDNPEVAGGYTKKGRGGDPRVYEGTFAKEPRLLNLDKPVPKGARKAFESHMPNFEPGDIDWSKPGREIYDQMKEAMVDEGWSRTEADEHMNDLVAGLQQAGYDGFAHQGGKIVGKTPHNVRILFGDYELGKPPVTLKEMPGPSFPGQGPEALRQTIRGHLDAGNAFGLERIAEDHGVSIDEARAIHDQEASSDPRITLQGRLAEAEQAIRNALRQTSSRRGSKGGGTNIFGQVAGHLALFAIKAAKAGVTFATWAGSMTGRFGAGIGKYLQGAWDSALMARDEINNILGGAMSTTKRIMPEIAQAAREFMGADSQGRAIWNNAKPFVDRIGGTGFFDNVLYPTLAQDRLYGIRIEASKAQAELAQIWQAAHQQGAWQANIGDLWSKSTAKGIVHAAGGGDIVEALLEDGKTTDALQTAIDTLQGVIDKKNDILTQAEFNQNLQHPAWKVSLQFYKDHVEPKMLENHQRWGGVQTVRLGKLDTYAPLVRDTGATATGGGKGATFKAPTNLANKMATGTSIYTTDPERVATTVIQRTKGSARAGLIKMLNERGLVQKAGAYGTPNPPMTIGGKSYPTVRKVGGSSVPVTLLKGGQSIHLAGTDSVLPTFLHKEIGQFLDRNNQPFELTQNPFSKAWDILASAKIVGVTEPIAHGLNTAGFTASSQPLIGSSFVGKIVKNLPGAVIPGWKTIMTFADRSMMDVTHPDFYEDTVDLARRGLLPTRAGKILGGNKVGMKYGPKNLVFGDQGFDLRNRVALLRYAKEKVGMDPDSPQGSRRIYDFVSGAGTYTYGLDSAMERSLKTSRFSPFATAAKSKLIGGVKAATGTSPLPQSGLAALPARLTQIATGGAGAYVASWYMANKLLGNDPDKQKLGDIPIPKGVPVIGGHTFKMGFAMPYTNAGMVDSGVTAYSNAVRSGKTHEQAMNEMTTAWINGGLKPVSGSPALNTMMESVGVAPYVEPDLTFLQVGKKKGLNAENVENALIGSLPFGGAIRETGIIPEAAWIEKTRADKSDAERVVDGLLSVFTPGAFRPSGKQIGELRLKALSDRDAAAKKGEGEPLSSDEAEELAKLKADKADSTPKTKTKRKPTETDTILKNEGRTQSGSKRKSRSGLVGMNEGARHRWVDGKWTAVG